MAEEWWRPLARLVNPTQQQYEGPNGTYAAPNSPVGRRRQRAAERAGLAHPNESLASYLRRTAPAPTPAADPNNAPAWAPPINNAQAFTQYTALARQMARERQHERDRQAVAGRELRLETGADRTERNLRNARNAPPGPREIFGQGMVDAYNAPSMIVADIPMGVATAIPRIERPYRTEGREVATGWRRGAGGWPNGVNVGTFRWGVDQRRPFRDVMSDVTEATGAPDQMLYMISRRENYPYLEAYDRPPSEGGGVSSARGPHQFTDGTWRTWAGGVGSMYGIAPSMSNEERSSLVDDPRFSGAMTAEMARYHAGLLAPRLGRNASIADIYMLHHGGEEAIPLVVAVGTNDRPDRLAYTFYNQDRPNNAVSNHPNDFFVGGDRRHPRTARQFYDWMTGQDPSSPHRRDYTTPGRLEGLPTTPVEFGARLDGSVEAATVARPGVLNLPSDSLLERRSRPLVIGTPTEGSR